MTDTHARIRASARDLFLEQGLGGFSMRRIAARADITATAIYRHYQDKDAVLLEVVDQAYQVFGSYLMRALSGSTPIERFRRMCLAYFDFATEHSRDYRLIFMTNCADLGLERLDAEARARGAGTFQFLMDRIRECIDSGSFRQGEVLELAVFTWSQTHGLVSLRLTGQLTEEDFCALKPGAIAGIERALARH